MSAAGASRNRLTNSCKGLLHEEWRRGQNKRPLAHRRPNRGSAAQFGTDGALSRTLELAIFRSVAVTGTHPKTTATGNPNRMQMTASARAPIKNLKTTPPTKFPAIAGVAPKSRAGW
jgi:hypothetical protein